ncbi:hypothetical protein [Metabacillus fastidiosus]|uniref:hypothetical protein n=1 Tax=Metabacillus fastidiosus TaxID=1458 RepID=UPI003D2C04D8
MSRMISPQLVHVKIIFWLDWAVIVSSLNGNCSRQFGQMIKGNFTLIVPSYN